MRRVASARVVDGADDITFRWFAWCRIANADRRQHASARRRIARIATVTSLHPHLPRTGARRG